VPTYVNPSGPRTATFAIVGEAPGEDEDRFGEPFVGAAGKFLNVLLGKAGIARADCYITNLAKVRPPNNDIKRIHEVSDPLEVWESQLREELSALTNLRTILLLGDSAFHALCGLHGITKWRGSALQWGTRWVVPTLHPSAVLQYFYKLHPVVVGDMIKAKSIHDNGLVLKQRSMIVEPTYTAALDYIESLQGAFAWDLETFEDQIACIGFARSSTDSICIPFKNGFSNYFNNYEERNIWEAIGKLMRSPDILKIGHNAFRFDNEFIKRIFGHQPNRPHFDTLLAHQLVSPDHPHALHFLTSIYTDMAYYKDDVKEEGERKFSSSRTFSNSNYFPTLWKYNCKDVLATYECYESLTKELKSMGMHDLFTGYIMPLYSVLFDVQNTGCRINVSKLDEMRELYEKESNEIAESIEKDFGSVKVSSNKQLANLLYHRIGLPTMYNIDKKTGKRSVTVDDSALESLLRRIETLSAKDLTHPLEVVKKLLKDVRKYRASAKLASTYLQRKILDDDDKVRTSYGVTETGRLASKQRLDKKGMNVQNIPSEIRVIFEAEDDSVLIEGDLSQAEARAVAYLAECQPLIDEFNRKGGDIFKFIGQWIFNKPMNAISKEERQLCKMVVHGCVTEDHEVLTLNGWVSIKDYVEQYLNGIKSPIAQWDTNESISFKVPKDVYQGVTQELYQMSGQRYSVVGTPCHGIPIKTVDSNRVYWSKQTLNDLPDNGRTPTSGIYEGNTLGKVYRDLDIYKFVLAIQADGHICSDKRNSLNVKCIFHLRKQRKINRLYDLINSLGLIHSASMSGKDITISVWFPRIYLELFSSTSDKTLSWFHFMDTTSDTRELLLEEILWWDGSRSKGSGSKNCYMSTNKSNVELMQTLAHLNGMGAILTEIKKGGNRKPLYVVSFNWRKFARLECMKKSWSSSALSKPIYCVTTDTGWWLCRHNNKITVQGNSHYGMGSKLFAMNLNLSVYEAMGIQQKYFKAFPEIKLWQKKVENSLRKTRQLKTPFGRIRTFFGRLPTATGDGHETLKEALAYVPQSVVGDTLNQGLLKLYYLLPKEAQIWLQVHDSVLVHVKKEKANEVLHLMKETLTKELIINSRVLVIPVELKMGPTWGSLKVVDLSSVPMTTASSMKTSA